MNRNMSDLASTPKKPSEQERGNSGANIEVFEMENASQFHQFLFNQILYHINNQTAYNE
jgi:hypothetical protein